MSKFDQAITEANERRMKPINDGKRFLEPALKVAVNSLDEFRSETRKREYRSFIEKSWTDASRIEEVVGYRPFDFCNYLEEADRILNSQEAWQNSINSVGTLTEWQANQPAFLSGLRSELKNVARGSLDRLEKLKKLVESEKKKFIGRIGVDHPAEPMAIRKPDPPEPIKIQSAFNPME
ncbi:MAG TPA: hypothetical protein VFH55_04740 [Nitrospiria bacterium]|nr:hypothetical protein [Nitrospiria bacterium]